MQAYRGRPCELSASQGELRRSWACDSILNFHTQACGVIHVYLSKPPTMGLSYSSYWKRSQDSKVKPFLVKELTSKGALTSTSRCLQNRSTIPSWGPGLCNRQNPKMARQPPSSLDLATLARAPCPILPLCMPGTSWAGARGQLA